MAEPAEIVRVVIKSEMDTSSQRATEQQFDQSMNKVTASAGKAEGVVTQAGASMASALAPTARTASTVGDAIGGMATKIASGTPAVTALAQQAGQMAGALAGGGGAGPVGPGGGGGGILGAALRVSMFFGGPWGIAMAAAGFALSAFLNRQKDESATLDEIYDKLVKSKAQTDLNRQAEEMWGNSLGGLIEKHRKLNAELDKRLSSAAKLRDATIAQMQLEAAQLGQYADRVARDPKATPEQKETARAAASNANVALFKMQTDAQRELGKAYTDMSGAAQLWGQRQADEMVKIVRTHPELNQHLHLMQGAVGQLEKAMSTAAGAGVSFGPAGREARKFYDQLYQGKIGAAEFTAEIKRVAAALDAQAEAARKARSASGGGRNQQFGRQVDQGDAAAIARRAGFQVNSSERPTWIRDERPGGPSSQERLYNAPGANTPGRPVAKPGTSAHEAGGDKWALDIQRTAGVTIASITKTFAAEGIKLTKIITEHGGRVFHVEGSRSEAARGERAESREAEQLRRAQEKAAAEAVRAAEERAQQQARFDTEMMALDDAMLDASATRATTMAQQLEQELAALDAATARQNAEYRIAEGLGRIAEGDAELLIGRNNQVATQRRQQIVENEALRVAEMNRQLALEQQDHVVNEASYQLSIAKTAAERLAASERLLDAEHTRERLALQAILDATKDGEAQHELAELRMQELERARARKEQENRNDPANRSPIEQYREDLNQTAGQIDESLQRITTDGLESLTDGLTDAVMGAKSLGEVFDDVADQIIRALIRIAIQQMIIKPLTDMISGMFGGGMSTSSFSGGGSGGGFGSFMPRASGGPISAGGAYMVGEEGPEAFFPNQSGQIVPNDALAKLGGSNAPAPNVVSLTVNAPGATAETVAMIRRELAAAAPTIVSAAQRSTIAQLSRTRT